jgi:abequosyltransferase
MPTYNFGAFIGETLESVLSQAVDGVEVVVLDGGSTDNTTDVVRSFERRYPSLRYHRIQERGGIDRDLARTVGLARGEYCWLFGSDDLMNPGAIESVLGHIRTGHDLYLSGVTLCTRDMSPLKEMPILKARSDLEFDLAKERGRRDYFERAQTTSAFFGFAGSLIINRARWESIALNEAFVGSCWAHVARIFEMLPEGLRLKYLATPLLRKRMENDSFLDQGIVHRFGITIDGYHRLADTFFPEDGVEARNIRRVVTNEFPPRTLLSARLHCQANNHEEELHTLDRLAATAYRDPSLRNRTYNLIYRRTPLVVYKAARACYRATRSLVRPSRSREGLRSHAAVEPHSAGMS